MPKKVSKRERILELKKASKKGMIADICSRTRDWEPSPKNLNIVYSGTRALHGGLYRTTCKYDEDVPIICAAPSLFALCEELAIEHGRGQDTKIINEIMDVIIATREMALERWEKKSSGLKAARRMHKHEEKPMRKPRVLKRGDLAPDRETETHDERNAMTDTPKLSDMPDPFPSEPQHEKVDYVAEISKLKEGLDA